MSSIVTVLGFIFVALFFVSIIGFVHWLSHELLKDMPKDENPPLNPFWDDWWKINGL